MDRGPQGGPATGSARDRAWSIVVVPVGGEGGVREYSITARQLRRLRWLAVATLAALVILAVGLGVTLPRSAAYGGLVEENLALRGHIQEIDRRMTEVDRILLRLRMYDAQLRDLAEPTGPHGPLPDDAFANHALLEAQERLQSAADPRQVTSVLDPSDLRPAEAWAMAVLARADTFVSLFDEAEPDLEGLVVELEDLRSLEHALPTSWPTNGRLTSGFGFRRSPVYGSRVYHHGLDIANGLGTPIYAAAPGRVVKADYHGGYGRMVEIDHGFGITTVYAHCHRLKVKVGQQIERGQFISTMGQTGQVTGVHLHFEVRIDGNAVDPLDYLPR